MAVKEGINEPLLRECIDYISRNPEEWNQTSWESSDGCKTTRCLAGWAIALHHGNLARSIWDIRGEHYSDDMEFSEIGGKLLGFDYKTEIILFNTMTSDLDQFKRHVTKFTGVEFKDEPADSAG